MRPLRRSATLDPATGFLHPILGWDHVAAMVAVGLWGAFLGSPAIWILPVAFPLLMALGGAGIAFPAVEMGIAASAMVIGGAVDGDAPAHLDRSGRRCSLRRVPRPRTSERDADGGEPADLCRGLCHRNRCAAGIAFGLSARSRPGANAVRAVGGVIALAGFGFLIGTL